MPSAVRGGHKLKAFLAAAKHKGVKEIHVGFFSTARYRDGTPVAAVAAWNEYGTESHQGKIIIPERPFIRRAVRQMRKPIRQHLRRAMKGSKGIMDMRTANRAGLIAQREIQKQIRHGPWKPNAPVTTEGGWVNINGKVFKIKGKKSTRPLIDTGLMRRSVTFRIVK